MKGMWFDANGFEIECTQVFIPGTIQETEDKVCLELGMKVLIHAAHWTLLGDNSRRLLIVEDEQETSSC
ncbi:hypothetical protein JCM19236_6374 [Vibrio sp. JCM 19236]|nr:hypothetical protein JCM19236_6374 [Vibrio sp. JCM 19236]